MMSRFTIKKLKENVAKLNGYHYLSRMGYLDVSENHDDRLVVTLRDKSNKMIKKIVSQGESPRDCWLEVSDWYIKVLEKAINQLSLYN